MEGACRRSRPMRYSRARRKGKAVAPFLRASGIPDPICLWPGCAQRKVFCLRTFALISLMELPVHFFFFFKLLPTTWLLIPLVTFLWWHAPFISVTTTLQNNKLASYTRGWGPQSASVKNLSYCGDKRNWQARLVPRVCPGGSDKGIIQEPRSRCVRQVFLSGGCDGGQQGRHRNTPEEKMLRLNDKLTSVQISELWTHGG